MATLYSTSNKLERLIQNDYAVAMAAVQGKSSPSCYVPSYDLIENYDQLCDMVNQIKANGMFSYDTEYASIPWSMHPLICIQISIGRGKNWILPWHHHNPYNKPYLLEPSWVHKDLHKVSDKLAEVFENLKIRKIIFNAKSDNCIIRKSCIKSNGLGVLTKGFILDPMVMHHLLDENLAHDLETILDVEYGWGDYAFDVREIVGHGDKKKTFDHIPDKTMYPYAATDAEGSYLIGVQFEGELQRKPHLWKLYVDECEPGIHAFEEAEWFGCKMDKKVILELREEYVKKQEGLLIKMRGIAPPDFNPASWMQVRDALTKLGYEEHIKDKNAASGYSTNETRLNEIKDEVPLAGMVLEYRGNNKKINTYFDRILEELDENDRFHPSYRQHGTKTGRYSAAVVHQTEKIDKKRLKQGLHVMRDMYTVDNGFKFIYGDYSQLDLWVIAIGSKDEEMLKILDADGDLHKATTATFLAPVWPDITEETVSDFNRTEVGKRINFGLCFGSEGHSLVKSGHWMDQKGVKRNITWNMLEEGMRNWKARFSGIGRYMEDVSDEGRMNGGIIRHAFGRERRMGSRLNASREFERKKAERESVSFMVQGPEGHLTIRTAIEIHKIISSLIEQKQIKYGDIKFNNTVHDSISYEVRDYLCDWFLETFATVGSRPVPELDNRQLKMKIGIGNNWSEAELNAG
jgi:DNA polymerase I-like protein with 3'-5' exonuclease and polymerase domains